ncbi:type II toxin-antitoxin system RelE/ParE family toxin [Azospirillum sp. TSO22-1]|uniref:type II toxin-antitoxin system RelE/ParE family toxin n=1 Tax=Azospirillum sp. TSO22-1 TaxID=716789 RepID=UPI000D64C2A5|nr:type II toxin-antitoxin system RelE/ParE family toxin [Azospirillum sp. TSO22-1]
MKVRWADKALTEAYRIFAYILPDNPTAARAVYDAAFVTANTLVRFPYRYRDRGGGYRRVPVAHYDYCILYGVRQAVDGPYVSIESVRHAARRPQPR